MAVKLVIEGCFLMRLHLMDQGIRCLQNDQRFSTKPSNHRLLAVRPQTAETITF
jgi:hypothetical protein